MNDKAIMKTFCDAGAAAMEAGLRHARQEDPHVYAELVDLLQKGLCVPELVIRFMPELSVTLRLIGDVMEDGKDVPMIIDVFSYGGDGGQNPRCVH